MNVTIVVDGVVVAVVTVSNLWSDLVVYAAQQWDAETAAAVASAAQSLLA